MICSACTRESGQHLMCGRHGAGEMARHARVLKIWAVVLLTASCSLSPRPLGTPVQRNGDALLLASSRARMHSHKGERRQSARSRRGSRPAGEQGAGRALTSNRLCVSERSSQRTREQSGSRGSAEEGSAFTGTRPLLLPCMHWLFWCSHRSYCMLCLLLPCANRPPMAPTQWS